MLLGFFEAGHWPCALVTAQRLLARRDRPLGNSILQSGASLGAIATPIVVLLLVTDAPIAGGCRSASSVRSACSGSSPGWPRSGRGTWSSSRRRCRHSRPENEAGRAECGRSPRPTSRHGTRTFVRRFLALAVVVIIINLCWQYFRAWMPGMLREQYGYSQRRGPVLLHRLLRGRGRRLPHDRVPGQVADGPGVLGPRSADDDVPGLLAPDGL